MDGSELGMMAECVSSEASMLQTELSQLKRHQLQKLCKKLGLKAIGKTIDLISRLSEHNWGTTAGDCIQGIAANETFCCSPLSVLEEGDSSRRKKAPQEKEASHSQDEDQLEIKGDSGWCVVHGLEIAGRDHIWSSLILKNGKPVVVDGDALVPLHLAAVSVETPPYLEDNRICQECVKLNRIKDSMLQTPTSRQQSGFSSSSSKNRYRRGKCGRYFPREDKIYATKVEMLLLKIASGAVTVDQAFGSAPTKLQHSPRC